MGEPGRRQTVSDQEILEVIKSSTDPVLTTREVAESIDMTRRGTLPRLQDLHDRGFVKRKKVGKSGLVWWIPQSPGSED